MNVEEAKYYVNLLNTCVPYEPSVYEQYLFIFSITLDTNILETVVQSVIPNFQRDELVTSNKSKGKSRPAPKNFWPYKQEFYSCAPVCTFSATVDNIYEANKESIIVDRYIPPYVDRSRIKPVDPGA